MKELSKFIVAQSLIEIDPVCGRASNMRVKFRNAKKSAPRESTGPRITTLATRVQASEGRGNQRKMKPPTVGKVNKKTELQSR